MLYAEIPNNPSPLARLGLTLTLGILGAWWMPFNMRFIPFVEAPYPALPVWLALAFVGVLLLHRVEGVKTPKILLVFMAMILALSFWFLSGYATDELSIELSMGIRLARFGFISFWVWIAGLVFFGRPAERGGFGSWVASLLRGAALAIASPLLLFASQPRGRERASVGTVIVSLLFLVFLFTLAAGSGVALISDDYYYRYVRPYFRYCAYFKIWAWLGCGLLFLLSPWPDESRWITKERLTRADRSKALAPLVVLGIALILLAILDVRRFYNTASLALLILYIAGFDIAFLLVLGPWPRWPQVPKLSELPSEVKINSLYALFLLTLAAIPVFLFTRHAIFSLFTGKLFEMKFDTHQVGWVLDQSTIQCGFWRFTLLSLMAMSYVAMIRWLTDRSTQWGYWGFTFLVSTIFLFLLSYLTCVFYGLLVYVSTMGLTPLRIYGLDYGVACYAVVFLFVRWAVRIPNPSMSSTLPF